MVTYEDIYESNRQKDIHPNSTSSQANPKKPRRLIIKNPRNRVRVKEGYLEIESDNGVFLAGFRQFDAIYLHKELELEISALYDLSRYMRVYLIDMHGNLLGKFKRFRLERL